MSDQKNEPEDAVKIKKYANRRLYNTATSAYVTLDNLAEMVKEGSDFVVHDAKTGEDITHQVLTQIIFEQENKGQNLLPIPFLRQLIRFYGDNMQGLVPSFLEVSLDQLARDQDKFRAQIADTFQTNPLELVEEQVRQNMTVFNDTMKMFTPFAGAMGGEAEKPSDSETQAPPTPGASPAEASDDLSALKDQLSAMQEQLNKLADKKSD